LTAKNADGSLDVVSVPKSPELIDSFFRKKRSLYHGGTETMPFRIPIQPFLRYVTKIPRAKLTPFRKRSLYYRGLKLVKVSGQ